MEMNPSTSVTGKRPREEEVATNGKGSENGNAEAKVSKIEENTTPHQQLSVAVTTSPSLDGEKKIVRVWADGCFDMMHFGHANALRQVRISLTHFDLVALLTNQCN
jgi:bifunctional ADP-heptose synthase (sugar kinase/adenylyltransferase)